MAAPGGAPAGELQVAATILMIILFAVILWLNWRKRRKN
jgi:cbb3-type cytochrome oxidase subunit 3